MLSSPMLILPTALKWGLLRYSIPGLLAILLYCPMAYAAQGGFTPSDGPPPPPATDQTDPVLIYFDEIALHSEYGNQDDGHVKKWMRDLRIQVHGAPTHEDLQILNTVIRELATLTNGSLHMALVEERADMDIYFTPMDRFPDIIPSYHPGNEGYFSLRWKRHAIYKATVLIDTDSIPQARRNHLIREEITQSLGLMNDSWRYRDSIFYQGFNEVQQYSDLDKQLIRLLYHPDIKPGMTMDQVRAVYVSQSGQADDASQTIPQPSTTGGSFELIIH